MLKWLKDRFITEIHTIIRGDNQDVIIDRQSAANPTTRDHLMFNLQCSTHAFEKHRGMGMRAEALKDCAAVLDYADEHPEEEGSDTIRNYIRHVALDMIEVRSRTL